MPMFWRVVRVVDGAALEMLCGAIHLGFESLTLRQRITVILIQRNDGYFIPKIDVLVTFKSNNLKASVIADLKSLNHSQSLNYRTKR